MSRRRWAWAALVFVLTLLLELPARWFSGLLPLPAQGLSGSLWHGQLAQLGDVGPLRWQWQPWQRQLQASVGYQGQRWDLALNGWPWRWQASLQPQPLPATAPASYRLGGDWQGRIDLQGSGSQCRAAQGQVSVSDLALSAPWQLALGSGHWRLDCAAGWHLRGELELAGQHQASLDADLLARRAQLLAQVQAGAGLRPLLVSARWLAADGSEVARTISW